MELPQPYAKPSIWSALAMPRSNPAISSPRRHNNNRKLYLNLDFTIYIPYLALIGRLCGAHCECHAWRWRKFISQKNTFGPGARFTNGPLARNSKAREILPCHNSVIQIATNFCTYTSCHVHNFVAITVSEEVPYYFSSSSIKFQGHMGWKIDDLDQIWARLLGQSQLSNPSDLPCLKSSVVFQGHTGQKICQLSVSGL